MNQAVTKAGFFPRLGAYLIDSCILGIVLFCLKIPVALMELALPDMFIFENVLFHYNIFDIIFYLLPLLYFVLTISITGTTIGKRAFNLTVVDKEGKNLTFWNALYRESVGRFLSGIFYFGYIMIFIDKNNRAFHDYLCDSSVVYTCKFKVVKKVVGTQIVSPKPDVSPVIPSVENSQMSGYIYKESNTTPQSTMVAEVEKENVETLQEEN